MNRLEKLELLAKEVEIMRENQKAYFRTRNKAYLTASKESESRVDKLLDNLAPDLFNDVEGCIV
jgi:hypothetical protein